MLTYEPGDIATFYFIISNDGDIKRIKAWSDRKQLLDYYMDFHKCPKYSIKKITKPIEEINKILEENYHDEIEIGNLYIKDPKGKHNDDKKIISVPITSNEIKCIDEECATALASRVGYSYLNGSVPYLKGKYREALDDIFLSSMIQRAIHTRTDKISRYIEFDQLIVFFRFFPDEFGK